MTERESVLDRAYRLAQEAETGGDHLHQAQNELNSIALNERAAIAAQMERDSRVDHAKHPEILELDVKVDPARKDNYVVSVHKPSPEEGTIRAGHDEYKMSGFGKTETIAGTVGGMTGTGIGGVGGYSVGRLAEFLYGLDGTVAVRSMELGAETGGAWGAAIGFAVGAAGYGVHELYELRKENPEAFDLVMREQLLHTPLP